MISVIVPVYCVEPYIRQCIESIINQTNRNLELLLIDDGSPDGCGAICDEYAQFDSRIRVFHTGNRGLSAARNLGLQEAKGEYIGFVDSDDWIALDMYETLLKLLEENNADISVCGVWCEYMYHQEENNTHKEVCIYTDDRIKYALVLDLFNSGVWNKLYKKKCLEGILFPEKHVYEDIATTHKIMLNAHSVVCTPAILYHYRMKENSVTHTYTMDNLKDHWGAYYSKYIFWGSFPDIKEDHLLASKMEEQIASAAARTWRWVYGVPKMQRDYVFLQQLSSFVRNHFSLFGNKDWKLYLRISLFFSHFTNEFSFFTLYVLNYCYHFFMGKKSKLFPGNR